MIIPRGTLVIIIIIIIIIIIFFFFFFFIINIIIIIVTLPSCHQVSLASVGQFAVSVLKE